MSAERIALLAGSVSLALILGALGFQYIAGMPPCEMCHWQRWPHIAAALIGIVGGSLAASHRIAPRHAPPIAIAALVLIFLSGAIGCYQAGVEWELLPGPAACTGPAVLLTGSLDLNHPVVRCDVAAWRLFGISLAGYNGLLSFATVSAGLFMLRRGRKH
jgi:disulfide bond formation protein DsbB